jgi:glutaredoxin
MIIKLITFFSCLFISIHSFATTLLYTTPGCGYCESARVELTQAHIQFIEENISQAHIGINVAPVLYSNTKYYIGLDQIEDFIKSYRRTRHEN